MHIVSEQICFQSISGSLCPEKNTNMSARIHRNMFDCDVFCYTLFCVIDKRLHAGSL